jgi:hypothetical protein
MKKSADLYEREGEWYFQPSSRTTDGLWVATPPVIQVNSHEPRQRKGEAALEVLKLSILEIPRSDDSESVIAPLLTKAGASSWREFARKAKSVGLELQGDKLTVIPYRRFGRSKDAFEGIPDEAIVLAADSSPEDVGAALEEAMSRCR